MAIEVELPDGTIVEFPDGTDNATMERALASYAASNAPITDLPAVQAQRPEFMDATATDGMSGLDRFRAGFGKSLVDTAHGLAQSAIALPSAAIRAGQSLSNAVLPEGSALRNAQNRVSNTLLTPSDRLRAIAAERRKTDEALMDTGAGMAGNVTGALATLVGPGILARGTSIAPALLPTTVRGNVAQGAAMGLLQPSTDSADAGQNVALGAGGGLLGAAIPAAVGGVVRGGRSLLAPFTERGAQDAAGRVVTGFAEDPTRLLALQQSQVPGVTRSLAESSGDPGIAQLQRTIAARNGAPFDMARRTNNAARVNAIRKFAGDEAAVAQAEAARSAAVANDYADAMGSGPIDISGTRQYLSNAIEGATGLAEVQPALMRMQGLLSRTDPSDVKSLIPEDRISVLENVRRTIGHGLEGKFSGEGGAALAGSRELIGLRDTLNQEIADQAPAFGNYLDRFRTESIPINRMQAGQELLRRGSGGVHDIVTGVESLTPSFFGRAVKNIDDIAASGTGFGKATAAGVFQPSDLATIGNVNDDLARQYFADTAARGSGSDTFQKLMTQGDVLGAAQELGVAIPGAGLIAMLGSRGRERVNNQIVAILADPAGAQAILAKASKGDRRIIQEVLNATGGRLGIGTGTSSGN